MPDIVSFSAENPEFPRVVEVRKLQGVSEFPFDLSPTAQEAQDTARLLGAISLRKLRFQGRLSPAPQGAWRLEANLGATVIQTCVLTLDPVTTRIDVPVHRLFTPQTRDTGAEIVISDTDDEELEPLCDRIDLGLVAIEALALALPPYPRREGVDLADLVSAPRGVVPLRDADMKPFAALATLRDKLGEES